MYIAIEPKNGRLIEMLSLNRICTINRYAEPRRFLIADETASKSLLPVFEAIKLLYEAFFDKIELVRARFS